MNVAHQRAECISEPPPVSEARPKPFAREREFVEEMHFHTRNALASLALLKGALDHLAEHRTLVADDIDRIHHVLGRQTLDLFAVVAKLDGEIRFVHEELLPDA